MNMKITRTKIIAAAVIILLLVVTFAMGGNYARPRGDELSGAGNEILLAVGDRQADLLTAKDADIQGAETVADDDNDSEADGEDGVDADEEKDLKESAEDLVDAETEIAVEPEASTDKYQTEPVPEGKPMPVEPQDVEVGGTAYTCTLSVVCNTILDNIDYLDPEKVELVPEDGVIFATKTVTFYEGESVFNVLQREMKAAKIHMEFVNTPIYNSAYIEGINNLYEFDCGEVSGWMYKVNDWFPNYGCSRYQLQQGDVIQWMYTCDLGRDVGGFYAAGGQQ